MKKVDMTMVVRSLNGLLGAKGFGMMTAVAAFALVASPESHSQARASGSAAAILEEVTVTARKKEESLDELPLAATAFSGDSLEARGVVQLDSVGLLAPNITFQNNPGFGGSSNSAAIRIRGIGAADFTPTTDPGVGIYVDGVYLARSVGSILDIVDFERVEVLRGPQGTLFGRNTIGGAISVITKRPQPELSGNVSATYGTDEWADLQGSVNFPLSDTLYAKLAVASFNQDGYVKRTHDGKDLGDDSTIAARFDLRWEPTDALTVDLSLDYSEDDENGPAMGLEAIRYGPQTIDPESPPFAFFNNVTVAVGGTAPDSIWDTSAASGPPPQCATAAMPLDTADRSGNTGLDQCYDNRYLTGENGDNQGTAPVYSDTEIFGAALIAEWEVNDSLTIKSTTSYRELESNFARDGDASPVLIAQYDDIMEQEQVSQEFQLSGIAADGRLDWTVGVYYFNEDGKNINPVNFRIAHARSGGYFDNESVAAFGQGIWSFTDSLRLTAGVRWTEDTRKFLPDQAILAFYDETKGFLNPTMQRPLFMVGTPLLPSVEAEAEVSETTPMVNLSYDASEEWMLYGMFSQGFKSGGFTQRVLPAVVPGATCMAQQPVDCIAGYDPEYVDVWEAGFRYRSEDNRYRFSGALFHTDYKDLQVSTFTSVAPVVDNAAEATIQGAELEFAASPVDNFLVEGSVGYTDPEYDEVAADTHLNASYDFERVSEWTANLGVSYDFFAGQWVVTPRVDWSYRSEFYNDAFNSPQLEQEAFSLVNINVIASHQEGYTVSAGILNATDETYLHSGVFGDAFSVYETVRDRGRQFYLKLGYSF